MPNADEECPYVFGKCPRIKRRIPNLEFKHSGGVRSLHSRLVTDDNNCQWGRRVFLFRVRPGKDRRVASLYTKSGGIHFEGRFRRGRYYAEARRRTLTYGACPRVRSRFSRPRDRNAAKPMVHSSGIRHD